MVQGSPMAREARQGTHVRNRARSCRRHCMRSGRPIAQIPHPCHLRAADDPLVCHIGQLALSCASHGRHTPNSGLRQVCGQGQHITRGNARALCHIPAQIKAETPQYVCLARILFNHNRLRRLGRSRRPDSLHRGGHRLKPRAGVPPVSQDSDDTRGMRGGRRHSRYIPRPHSRNALHA